MIQRKIKIFGLKISHHFLELNKLILKMYSVLRFKAVFHKIIEENCKKLCVEISYSNYKTLNNVIYC